MNQHVTLLVIKDTLGYKGANKHRLISIPLKLPLQWQLCVFNVFIFIFPVLVLVYPLTSYSLQNLP